MHLVEMKGYLRVANTEQPESDGSECAYQADEGCVCGLSKNYARGTKVAYDFCLIEDLRLENRQLLMHFSKINQALRKNELEEVAIGIQKFKSILVAHFYKTTLKLYIYLQYSLPTQSKSFSTMRDFRKKMTTTSTMILRDLDYYIHIDQKPELLDECILKFAEIKDVLSKRISQEEKIIYPIYCLLGNAQLKGFPFL